ncbi:serum response factor b isoform X1 [Polypterus senegalus]|uniref:serum response factor b isoform X1 n=1 Tax=Polypterus senegalus TaxID=55291 RepID=UPI0019669D25|nr:serum response factor b isoform X1 [Polypterus senegalus]
MLPSQVGSAPAGNGSGSARGSAALHGVVGHGVSTGLTRSTLVGVSGSGTGMLGGSGVSGVSRGGTRPGNGAGLTALPGTVGGPGADRESSAPVYSGSDADSDSGDDDEPMMPGDARKGMKREREDLEAGLGGQESGLPAGNYGGVSGGVAGAKPGKKTRGRVKIKMEFIDNKLRRYTTFSKRKTGIMKKTFHLYNLHESEAGGGALSRRPDP